MEIDVYTDGSCSNNGKKGAIAGLGVYFKENDCRNCSERIEDKQTNNTAELKAIIKACEILEKEILKEYIINIYSDSMYSINCFTVWGKKWRDNEWKKSGGKIKNIDLVKKGFFLLEKYKNIKLFHIEAHTGKNDKHSLGNEGADKLANLAIGQTECPYANKSKKIYLNLPYNEKEEGKKLGTKWDPKNKKWYIMSDTKNKESIINRWE